MFVKVINFQNNTIMGNICNAQSDSGIDTSRGKGREKNYAKSATSEGPKTYEDNDTARTEYMMKDDTPQKTPTYPVEP